MTTPAASVDQARLGISRSLVAVTNEVTKGLRHAWAELVQILVELPLFAASALLFSLLLGRGEEVVGTGRIPWQFDPYRTTWLILGFTAFTFVYLQSVKTFWRLLGEIQAGTLEQAYLSPLPAWLNVAVGRISAAIVESALVVGALYLVTSFAVDLQLTWSVSALLPLALLVVGSTGYSLLIAGLTLAWKRVELLQEMMLMLIMTGSGALIPLQNMPGWVGGVADLVFITHPIQALRTTMLDGGTIPLWGTGGWAAMTATAALWLALGVGGFWVGSRNVRRHGTLSRY